MSAFDILEATGAARCLLWSDLPSGLRAVAVIDDLRLGPAAGGIRTGRYPSIEAAITEAAALARAMTLKCALGGIAAGGAKIVVLDHQGLDRPRAFARLGELVEELGGLVRTAGDLGTSDADLEAAAARSRYVNRDEGILSQSVARGVVRCLEACVAHRRFAGSLRVAVQGLGHIGSAVARALGARGARLVLADLDRARAEALAHELEGEVALPEEVLQAEVDVVSPCAIGGVLDRATADSLRAWAIVGGANNLLADASVADRLHARGILYVPDIVASAGAVIDGVGRTVMGLEDTGPLIERLGETTRTILLRAEVENRSTSAVALEMAEVRLASAHGSIAWSGGSLQVGPPGRA